MPEESDRLLVKVQASIANLGPGFDVFALALNEPFDFLEVEKTKERGVRICVTGVGSEEIPESPELNTAGLVAGIFLEKFDQRFGVRLKIHKGIPPGFGLG